MNKIDIVRNAFSFDDPEGSQELFSDDFQATDSVGGPPMDRAGWFGMGEMMRASFPDIDYVIDDIKLDGEDVLVVGRFKGTFQNDFDLSAMNMGVIPASGNAVEFPDGTSRVSFEGDKIARSHSLDTGPEAGMAGFIAVLKG
jgi:predicted ester cyclase